METELKSLLGKDITFLCMNYFYCGKLVAIMPNCVKLENPKVIFETGRFNEKNWEIAERLPNKYFYITMQSIESFGELKK